MKNKTHAIQWPEDLKDSDFCPLKPHRNKRMDEVPFTFLKWVHHKFTTKEDLTSQAFWLVSRYYTKKQNTGAGAKS